MLATEVLNKETDVLAVGYVYGGIMEQWQGKYPADDVVVIGKMRFAMLAAEDLIGI